MDERHPGDCYVRLRGSALRSWHRGRPGPGALAFVDVAAEDATVEDLRAGMRAVPGGALTGVEWLLLRLPDALWTIGDDPIDLGPLAGEAAGSLDLLPPLRALADDLERRIADQGHRPPRVGLVRFPLGAPPAVVWGVRGEPDEVDALLQRARRAELETLLAVQEAVSTPATYHYRLPSGAHAASFVRAGDVFRDVRSAASLATWLRVGLHLSKPTVVVLDSGTLAPLATELSVAARLLGRPVPSIVSLDEYPNSSYEYRRIFSPHRPTGEPPTPPAQVLCVLSVASSGRMRDRAVAALDATVGSGSWRLEPLISRGRHEASGVATTPAVGLQEAWLRLKGHYEAGGPCRLCNDPARGRLVSIDPRNFSAKSLPEPQMLMPLTGDGTQNQSLWNRYDGVRTEETGGLPAISLHGRMRSATTPRGPQGGLYFEPGRVVDSGFADLLDRRLTELQGLRPIQRNDRAAATQSRIRDAVKRLREGFDVVILDQEDVLALSASVGGGARADEASVVALLKDGLSSLAGEGDAPEIIVVRGDREERSKVLSDVASRHAARRSTLLLFTLGLRMGVTLQRLLVDVHDAWRGGDHDPVIKGLIVHAHPEDARAWDGVRNAFWHEDHSELVALWLSYLPLRSPLDDELDLLGNLGDLPPEIKLVVDERLRVLRLPGLDAGSVRPFWTGREWPLRRTSYFGDRVHDRTTLVAVGSAMQRARMVHRPNDSPFWYRFDLPKIFRSYFDGLIHVSVLRWLRPQEAWWGANEAEAQQLLEELKHQAPDDWELVLPELLLASALGKVDRCLSLPLLDEADRALRQMSSDDGAVAGFLRLGRYLVDRDLGDRTARNGPSVPVCPFPGAGL